MARFTNDIDVVADLSAGLVPAFCEALGTAFYADPETASRAVAAERSFNVIYLDGAYKFDIFPVGSSLFARSELSRRRFTTCAISGLAGHRVPSGQP